MMRKNGQHEIPHAWWAGKVYNLILSGFTIIFFIIVIIYYINPLLQIIETGNENVMAAIWFVAFLLLWWLPISWFEIPIKTTKKEDLLLDKLIVTVQIPVYNEDNIALKKCLESVFSQSRKVDRVRIVNDGSFDNEIGQAILYEDIQKWFFEEGKKRDIFVTWDYTENRGKRHAQMHVLSDDPGDIFITLDSDSILDKYAVEEGLKPFSYEDVMSVAGCVIVLNPRTNFLTMLICMLYTPFTRGFRSAQSVMGSVMVNSGTLAFYRGNVIRKRASIYPYEKFIGRPMQMNDDSMMTMYAMLDGKTVHQPSSIVFTLVPERWKHYKNQTLRWMRGTFVRTLWWIKYMPITSTRFWMPLLELFQLLLSIVIGVWFIIMLKSNMSLPKFREIFITSIFVTLMINYLIGLRYFMVKRDDQSFWFDLFIFSLAPLAAIWRTLILRPIHLYAIATCWKVNKWGTRDKVEVEKKY